MQDNKFKDKTKGIVGSVKITTRNVKTGKVTVDHILNTFIFVGKESIADRLANQGSSTAKITYFAVGTGSDTPGESDINLHAELFRKPISVSSVTSNVATFTTYLATSEANDTLTEIGLFGDLATSTGSSGTLYAKTSINKVKTSSDTLTIEWSITIN